MVHPAHSDLRVGTIAVRDDVGVEVTILEYRRSEYRRLEWSQHHPDADRTQLLTDQLPVLRECREMEKVDREPCPVGHSGYSPGRPWPLPFLLPTHAIKELPASARSGLGIFRPAAWAQGISLEMGAAATFPSPRASQNIPQEELVLDFRGRLLILVVVGRSCCPFICAA